MFISNNFTSLGKKMSGRAAAVDEICKVEGGEDTVYKTTPIEWFRRRSDNGETSIEDQLSTMNNEVLGSELVEEQPQRSTRHGLLSAELGPSKLTIAPHRLNKSTSEQGLPPRSSHKLKW